MTYMIFGAGYSGRAIGKALVAEGRDVAGTTRSGSNIASLESLGLRGLVFDGTSLSDSLRAQMKTVTHLIQSIAPGKDGDPLVRLAADDIRALFPALVWIGYLSTVGVYGDHNGAWVDETSQCKPVSQRSVERVEAEQAWLAIGQQAGIPVAVLRLSGIYGPGRNAFVNLAQGTARRLVKKDQVFNRIRVEDIASASVFLMNGNHGGLFNITDHEPCPPQDVVTEAARLMEVEPPEEMAFETAELSPMARSFYGENKRVLNRRIRDLGFSFAYPDYRISLSQLWNSNSWKA
jgi:nucleoside-diphosphate-sugar epimerase